MNSELNNFQLFQTVLTVTVKCAHDMSTSSLSSLSFLSPVVSNGGLGE